MESGFQLAVSQGPLCAEPVQGLAYFVEEMTVDWERITQEIGEFILRGFLDKHLMNFLPELNRLSQVTGSLISAARDACRNGLLDWSPRLMLAMYSCDIQCSGTRCYSR